MLTSLMVALPWIFAVRAASHPADGWVLSTADTRMTVNVEGEQPVVRRIDDVSKGNAWVDGVSVAPLMPRVEVGGADAKLAWRFDGGELSRDKSVLTLLFRNEKPKLLLKSIWRARSGPGPVEHWVTVENRSGARVTVPQMDSLSLAVGKPAGDAQVWWIKRGGSNASTEGGTFQAAFDAKLDLNLVSNCDDGASAVPWLAVQSSANEGLYVGWEFSGLGRVAAKARADGSAVDLRVGLMPEFKTDVEPGETFVYPTAFVGCYSGDIDDGSYALHQWILKYLRPKLPDDVPDPILAYNLYLDAGGASAKEADVLRSAAFCHDIGFEAFMPDAMWFPGCGDWRWDPARFPNGVKPIEEYVHKSGMRLAQWCAWTNGGVSEDAGALSVRGAVGHPDWFNADYKADWQPGPFYGANLCLASPEAKAWEIAKTQWLVGNHKLDYLKHDCGPIITQCNKSTHRHHYGVDASYWATMGYYEVQEKLRAAYPNIILENCSGGGHIKDFGIIQRTHYTVTTDTLSNLPDRQSIYDSTFALPPTILQAYTYEREYKVPGDDPGSYLWRSAMMGAWQIDPTNTQIWTADEKESAIRDAQIYKEWIRPMLKDVKVHHILPRPDGVHWDGMFYWSPGLKRGTLYVFRPNAMENFQSVKLKGLDAAKKYWMWSEDGATSAIEQPGSELMDKGVPLSLTRKYSCDLVYVQDAELGKPAGLEKPGAFQLSKAETDSDAFHASVKLTWTPSEHARSYRVVIGRAQDFTDILAEKVVSGQSTTFTNLPPDLGWFWFVEAIAWGGRTKCDDAFGEFQTPKLKPLPDVTFVSDMEWVRSTAGADNSVHRDTNYFGGEIHIAGKAYPKGLWTHAFNDATPADVLVTLAGKGFAKFVADAGVEDSAGQGSVQFQVIADGAVKADSGVMKPGAAHHFEVDIAGAKEIVLRVLNGGDGYSCDHSAWGGARLIKAGATDPLG